MKTLKILSASQTKALDTFTIEQEGIASVDLMERASVAFVNWFMQEYFAVQQLSIHVFCGLGNNGGDGLAIARLLRQKGFKVNVFVVEYAKQKSADCEINFGRIQEITSIQTESDLAFLKNIKPNEIIIDALLGAGVNRSVTGILKTIIEQINALKAIKISIDIASGLYMDSANLPEDVILKPDKTITFQLPKLAMMLPQNQAFVGDWQVIDIGLNQQFIQETKVENYYLTEILPEVRQNFSHKGTYGHSLLIAGSRGMMGAAILSAKACLRSGVGKLTCLVPDFAYDILQISVPEAMTLTYTESTHEVLSEIEIDNFQSIAIGPGIATKPEAFELLKSTLLLAKNKAMVIDADALNLLGTEKGRALLTQLPKNTILTPHPKEFQKLIGHTWKDDFEKLNLLRAFAEKYEVIVVLKGYQSAIAMPDGDIFFNSTGNAGMATAGSGDVLTGIIVALLAQGYSAKEAALLGVYQHGKAGDFAATNRGKMALIASDIIENLRW